MHFTDIDRLSLFLSFSLLLSFFLPPPPHLSLSLRISFFFSFRLLLSLSLSLSRSLYFFFSIFLSFYLFLLFSLSLFLSLTFYLNVKPFRVMFSWEKCLKVYTILITNHIFYFEHFLLEVAMHIGAWSRQYHFDFKAKSCIDEPGVPSSHKGNRWNDF